jgi:hypothetical protein
MMISGKETDDVSGAAYPAEGHLPPDEPETALSEADDLEEAAEHGAAMPPPPEIADLAEACVRFIAARYGATLDFNPDTLSFVDHWIRDARADVLERPEAVEIVQASAGAYLGEVIRRAFGAHWATEGGHADWRLELERVYCSFNPIGMVREALMSDTAEGWHAHFELDPAESEAMEERLATLPPATSDEYYAPSTRFDVVSILFDALRSGMRARGLADVRFTAEDYR